MLRQFWLPFISFKFRWFTSPLDIVELGEVAKLQKAKFEAISHGKEEQQGMLREFVIHSIWEARMDLRVSNVAYCGTCITFILVGQSTMPISKLIKHNTLGQHLVASHVVSVKIPSSL
jgi:hypothetical protein